MGANNFSGSSVSYVVIGKSFYSYYQEAIESNITIYGYSGSNAQTYAGVYGNIFVAIDEFSIVNDLPSNKNISQFEQGTLEVEATGFGLTYQWYKTSSNIENGVALDGQVNSILQIPSLVPGQITYFVKITNWDGQIKYSSLCKVSTTSNLNYVAQVYMNDNWYNYETLESAVVNAEDNAVVILVNNYQLQNFIANGFY